MTIEIIILFAMTEFLLSISPGPAVLLVVTRSMRYGASAGFRTSMGIALANVFFYSLSAFGIGAAILASHTIFQAIKLTGAAYLVWLGLTMIWPALSGRIKPVNPGSALPLGFGHRHAMQGFAVQIANPKNLVAFLAIIPQFVTPGPDIALQFFTLALVTIAVELPILFAYALTSEKASLWSQGKLMVWIETIAGGWLMAAGAGLAIWRRAEN